MQDVTLHTATAADHILLSNLLELYIHDLSEIFPVKVGAEGRFGYEKLALYWSEPATHFAYLIRCNAEVAGFALVARGSPASDDPDALDLAEFFVMRSYRRNRVGRNAAFALWDLLAGQWVVRVSEMNRSGLVFWEGAVRDYTHGAFAVKSHPDKSSRFRAFSFAGGVSPRLGSIHPEL